MAGQRSVKKEINQEGNGRKKAIKMALEKAKMHKILSNKKTSIAEKINFGGKFRKTK